MVNPIRSLSAVHTSLQAAVPYLRSLGRPPRECEVAGMEPLEAEIEAGTFARAFELADRATQRHVAATVEQFLTLLHAGQVDPGDHSAIGPERRAFLRVEKLR